MFFKGKKILVIGGTGTIGKSIVRSILKEKPKLIRVFSRDEYKLQQLQNEIDNNGNIEHIIGDVRDYESVFAAMQGIDYVFHLAAMKHVDFCENNPVQAIKTNIEGTKNMIGAAIAQNVKKAVFTSSDKAISPTNTYGATKLIAERLISSAQNNKAEGQTIFASVRFGNVMGSRGSVIPLFQEQMIHNRKIKITDYDITRYMMTLKQATQLTMKALMEAKGGEVFVLKMPVVKLGDLTNILIEEVCNKNQIDKDEIVVEVIGLRPGEKMYEELMTYDETRIAWEIPDMYIIPNNWAKDTGSSYEGAKKVNPDNYSSMNQKPLNIHELRQLLQEEKLI